MIKLNGHSGCNVALLESGVVRKTSSGKHYNGRLLRQMEKQIEFSHPLLSAPIVFDSGYDKEGNFFFDMEFIRGKNLCSIFIENSSKFCMNIIEKLTATDGKVYKDIRNPLENKLQSLNVNIIDFDLIMDCDWSVASGQCHGDMTFENIIISDKGVYLIDFLDSFVEAPLIDQSKLLQDAYCYWSFGGGYIPKRKLVHVSERFNTRQHFSMLMVHLLRILPYVTSSKKENVLCMMEKVRQRLLLF